MTTTGPRSTVAAFAPNPTSSSNARRFVRHALDSMGVESNLIDQVVLVASELVTNAVLHAHAGPVLTVQSSDELIRLEVEDSSELFPLLRNYGGQAVTGRGLGVVEASATWWGVDVTQNGKRVWAEFTRMPERDSAYLNGDRTNAGLAPANSASTVPSLFGFTDEGDTALSVYFLGVPVRVCMELEQHSEALMREFELLSIGVADSPNERHSPELEELVTNVQPLLSEKSSDFRSLLQQAQAGDDERADIEATCSETQLQLVHQYMAVLVRAQQLSSEGQLLTSPASETVITFCRWLVQELERQVIDRLPARPLTARS